MTRMNVNCFFFFKYIHVDAELTITLYRKEINEAQWLKGSSISAQKGIPLPISPLAIFANISATFASAAKRPAFSVGFACL